MRFPPPDGFTLEQLEAACRAAGRDNRAYGFAVGLAGERSTVEHPSPAASDNFEKLAAAARTTAAGRKRR